MGGDGVSLGGLVPGPLDLKMAHTNHSEYLFGVVGPGELRTTGAWTGRMWNESRGGRGGMGSRPVEETFRGAGESSCRERRYEIVGGSVSPGTTDVTQ